MGTQGKRIDIFKQPIHRSDLIQGTVYIANDCLRVIYLRVSRPKIENIKR